jgi:hypothetical protein
MFPPNIPEFKKQIWKKENLKSINGCYKKLPRKPRRLASGDELAK